MREDSYTERRRLEAEYSRLEAERRRLENAGRHTSKEPGGLEDLRHNTAFRDQGRGLIQRGPTLSVDQINQGN